MKILSKIIAAGCLTLAAFSATAEIKYVEQSLRSTNAGDIKATESSMGKTDMTSSVVKDWPGSYDDSSIPAALVRVKFKNIARADIDGKFNTSVNNGKHIVGQQYKQNGGELELWVFVDPGKSELDFVQTDGLGQVRVPEFDYVSHQMYTLTLESGDVVAINFTDPIGGTKVWLDNAFQGVTQAMEPLTVNNVSLGSHSVKYEKNGRSKTETIEVSPGATAFNADTREPIMVTFETDEVGAGLTIDNDPEVFFPESKTYTVPLFEGKHTVIVRTVQAGGEGGVEHPITVTPTQNKFNFKATQTRTINFAGTYANRPTTGITITLDNPSAGYRRTEIGTTPTSLALPYGKYKVNMAYAGSEKSGTLRVNPTSPSTYSLSLTPRRQRWNPLDVDYEKRIWGISAAWVQKHYVMSYGSEKANWNMWEDGSGEMINGIQFGIPVMPELGAGFIVNTGLFMEVYFSTNENWDFTEYSFYVPAHIGYKVPFTENFSMYVTGGIGMDLGVAAELGYDDEKYDISYGDDGMWNAFQLNAEIQAGLRIKALQLSFNYGWGLLNNKGMVVEDLKCKLQKMTCTLALMF